MSVPCRSGLLPRTYLFVPGSRPERFAKALCPKQVEPIHHALEPSATALDWPRRVFTAEAASPGAAQLEGRMVDRPVVLHAERILTRSAR